jgi:hypothetical protein
MKTEILNYLGVGFPFLQEYLPSPGLEVAFEKNIKIPTCVKIVN